MKVLSLFIGIFSFWAIAVFCQTCEPQVRIFKIGHGSAESFYAVANNLISPDGKLSFDRNTNSLIVFDCPQNLERIAGVIKTLDIRGKQVEVKVLIVETTAEFLSNIGITDAEVIIPQSQFNAITQLLKTDKAANIRSQTSLKTLSNQPALIQVTSDEIIGNEVFISENGAEITSPIRKPMGNFLEVLPSVNNDGTINIILRPSLSTLEKNATSSERTILTQVAINNGDTIVIGAAETEKEATQEGRVFAVPLSKKATSEKKKVTMFLTANIID